MPSAHDCELTRVYIRYADTARHSGICEHASPPVLADGVKQRFARRRPA